MGVITYVSPATDQPGNPGGGVSVPIVGISNSGTAGSAVDLQAGIEAAGYGFSLHLFGTFVATVVVEGSNDNANWSALLLARGGSPAAPATTATAAGLYVGTVPTRYVRARVSAYTSGTIGWSFVTLSADFPLTGYGVFGSVATDSPVSTLPVYTAARGSRVKPTEMGADGRVTPFWTDRFGGTIPAPRPIVPAPPTQQPVDTVDAKVLDANPLRTSLKIANDALGADMYIRFGTSAASSSSYHEKVPAGWTYKNDPGEIDTREVHISWSSSEAGRYANYWEAV